MENNNAMMGMMSMPMAPGFKFVPTDDEIIRFFLTNKIHGHQFPWLGIMPEFDLYGERGPWDLLRTDEYPLYVFAMSKNISKERKQRTCDFGTWKLQKNDEEIVYGGQVIGSKALLTFMPDAKKVEDMELGGSWHMSEFSLPDSKDKECLVVCKVSFKSFDDEDKSSITKKRSRQETKNTKNNNQNIASKSKKKIARKVINSSNEQVVEQFSGVISEEPSSSSIITTADDMIRQAGGGAELLVQQTIDHEAYNEDWCLDISELDFTADEVSYCDHSKDNNGESGAGDLDPFYSRNVIVQPDFHSYLNHDPPQPSTTTGTTFTDMMIEATNNGWDADSCAELDKLLENF